MPIGGFDNLKDSGSMNEAWRYVELREQADIHRRTWHQRRSFKAQRKRDRAQKSRKAVYCV